MGAPSESNPRAVNWAGVELGFASSIPAWLVLSGYIQSFHCLESQTWSQGILQRYFLESVQASYPLVVWRNQSIPSLVGAEIPLGWVHAMTSSFAMKWRARRSSSREITLNLFGIQKSIGRIFHLHIIIIIIVCFLLASSSPQNFIMQPTINQYGTYTEESFREFLYLPPIIW